MMNRRKHWLQGGTGFGLLVILTVGLVIILRRVPAQVQTRQEKAIPIAQVQPVVTNPDSPLPPAIEINPPPTLLPTIPPPPTPTLLPGPSATAMPLSPPAADAAGSILYPTSKTEIKPGYPADMAVYSITVDKAGQPQGKPVQLGNNVQVSGFFTIHPSPDGSRLLVEDGWGVHSLLYTESGKIDSPFHDNQKSMAQFFDWHPDNRRVLIQAQDNYIDIGLWLLDTDTGNHVTLHALSPSPSVIGGAVSPDGQKIIYAIRPDFITPAKLWVVNADGSSRQQIYSFDGDIVALAWSPDGKKIAFLGNGVMLIDADGSNPHTVGKYGIIGDGFKPVWSPDSRMLAYVAHEKTSAETTKVTKDSNQADIFSNTNIHLVDATTGEEHPLLTDSSAGNIDPAWSPDGSQLAFISNRSGTSEIWLVQVDGSNLRELTSANQFIRFPYWQGQPKLNPAQQ